MSDAVRIALVGAGRWGRIVVRALGEVDGARLVVLASRSADAAGLVAPGCRIEPDWQAAVASDEVDAVIVTTPPETHAAIARSALSSDKAVFVEKPITTNPGAAQALLQLASERRRVLRVDHTDLYNPAWQALKRELSRVGEIVSMDVSLGNPGPCPAGGLLWEWGPHGVGMFVDLFGAPRSVRVESSGASELTLCLAAASASARITLAAGLASKQRRASLVGRTGELVYDDRAAAPLQLDGRPLPVPGGKPLTLALCDFLRAVREKDQSLANPQLAVHVVDALATAERQ